jgi:undecaprenyl-diphosphatase
MTHLTYLEAAVVGLVQGITEMFPVSSLGHNVLIPAIIGGSWASDLNVSKAESPYLAFIVGLHVATAIALLIYFRRDWIRIIGGFFTSIRDRRVRTEDQKLAWMIILATIPVGIVGLLFEHAFRVIFGKPILAGIFLAVNGVILIAGERYRTRASKAADAAVADERDPRLIPAREPELVAAGRGPAGSHARASARDPRQQEQAEAIQSDRRLARMSFPQTALVGSAQILALLAGISREGVTMVGGLTRGLNHEDALRFSFLLSTPVILAAGILKISDLTGPLGAGVRGQIIAGSIAAAATSLFAVLFLARWFRTRTLVPFAVYCLLAGLASAIRFGFFG